MEVNRLDKDELLYELKIRGIVGIDNIDEMRTVLHGLLKIEPGHEVQCAYSSDANQEVTNCISKIQNLKILVDSVKGSRLDDSYRTADTKLYHLLGRIDRICSDDEKVQKTRSVLLKTILHLMREMELKVTDSDKLPRENQASQQTSSVAMVRQAIIGSEVVSNSNDDVGVEIFNHQDVIMKNLKFSTGNKLPKGILSIVQYRSGKWIEWKQNNVPVVRNQSSMISGNPQLSVQMEMGKLKSYKIKHHNRQISLLYQDGQHYSYVFQYGNVDGFVSALRAVLNTRRTAHNQYAIINERKESASLATSFKELNLFPDQRQNYIRNFVRNFHNTPYETTMQTFSKLTDVFLYRQEDHRPLDEDVAELLSKSLNAKHEESAPKINYIVTDNVPKFILPQKPSIMRRPILSSEQWISIHDSEGRITESEAVKYLIFKGSIDSDIRSEVWKYLLGYYPWNFTRLECEDLRRRKSEEYIRMKSQWQSISPDQEERFSSFREKRSLICKDVYRTDRTLPFYAGEGNPNVQILSDILITYVMYNFDLGYVQGMSDLLSPVLYLMNDETDAFWCFSSFMNRISSNFDLDQAGMKKQMSQLYSLLQLIMPDLAKYLDEHDSSNMFFCFRWLLVLFKRELSYLDTMALWEILWTDLPSPNYHLLICVAILCMEKENLMKPGFGFTEILKYINDLSEKMKLEEILLVAEEIFNHLQMNKDKIPLDVKRIIGLASSFDNSTDSDIDSIVSSTSKRINVI